MGKNHERNYFLAGVGIKKFSPIIDGKCLLVLDQAASFDEISVFAAPWQSGSEQLAEKVFLPTKEKA